MVLNQETGRCEVKLTVPQVKHAFLLLSSCFPPALQLRLNCSLVLPLQDKAPEKIRFILFHSEAIEPEQDHGARFWFKNVNQADFEQMVCPEEWAAYADVC
jgi:hypothetical protein